MTMTTKTRSMIATMIDHRGFVFPGDLGRGQRESLGTGRSRHEQDDEENR